MEKYYQCCKCFKWYDEHSMVLNTNAMGNSVLTCLACGWDAREEIAIPNLNLKEGEQK